jgi:phosphoribosylformylglycinamidine (FGAM) synthase-like amidotransferase family enzyme
VTALITPTDRFSIMMPHPGRVHPTVAMNRHSVAVPEESPWVQLVPNIRAWLG